MGEGKEEGEEKRKEEERGEGREKGKKEDSHGDREGQRDTHWFPRVHTHTLFLSSACPGFQSVIHSNILSSESSLTVAANTLLLLSPQKPTSQSQCCQQRGRKGGRKEGGREEGQSVGPIPKRS